MFIGFFMINLMLKDLLGQGNKFKNVNLLLFLKEFLVIVKCGAFVSSYFVCSKSEAKSHIEEIAKQLDELDADIFHLAEVEDCEALSLVKDAMQNGAQYKIFFVQGTDSATGQDVILLSRVDPSDKLWRTSARASYPLANSECGYDDAARDTAASKHLFAKFKVDNFPEFLLVGKCFKTSISLPKLEKKKRIDF
jgi:hypothetical protein